MNLHDFAIVADRESKPLLNEHYQIFALSGSLDWGSN